LRAKEKKITIHDMSLFSYAAAVTLLILHKDYSIAWIGRFSEYISFEIKRAIFSIIENDCYFSNFIILGALWD